MTPTLINGPAVEPVSLAETKAWLRIDNFAEDALVSALVTSARLVLEAATRTLFISQSWRITWDEWPEGQMLEIPLAPLLSLDALRVFDAQSQPIVISSASYVLDSAPLAPRLFFPAIPQPPARPVAGIEMLVTLGYGASPSNVPEPLRQAIKMLAARWFENRGDAAADARALPPEIAGLVMPYRRVRLA